MCLTDKHTHTHILSHKNSHLLIRLQEFVKLMLLCRRVLADSCVYAKVCVCGYVQAFSYVSECEIEDRM